MDDASCSDVGNLPQERTCTKCSISKPLSDFGPSKLGRYGTRADCRQCHRLVVSSSRKKRVAKLGIVPLGGEMQCGECGLPCTRGNANQKYCQPCAVTVERRLDREAAARQVATNPNRPITARRASIRFREKNGDSIRAREREIAKRPEIREAKARRARERRASDPTFRLHGRVTASIRGALKSNKAGRSWEALVGYDVNVLRLHLERQFLPGMTWENMSRWEVDHILPRSSFQYATPEDPEFKACWALTNLRPLWSEDNRLKSNKILTLL